MARSKKTTALAVAAGVLTLGAGIGAASLASADPTPAPSTSPSQATPSPGGTPAPGTTAHDHSGPGRAGGRHQGRGPGGGGGQQELAKTLAAKLGVAQARVTEALKAFHQANRPTAPPARGTVRPDPAARDTALAKSLASSLKIDQAKVARALAEVRTAREADRASALKTRLDAAVTAGTLTRAEADAVTKAVAKGVVTVGPR